MNPFDAASPFDARYYFADAPFFERLNPYVSENAQVRNIWRASKPHWRNARGPRRLSANARRDHALRGSHHAGGGL